MSSKDTKRYETLDNTPMAIPVGFKRPPSLQEQIRGLIRHERYQQLVNDGSIESLEEADDFDIDDDGDPPSRWEHEADETDFRQLIRQEEKNEQRRAARKKAMSKKEADKADTE